MPFPTIWDCTIGSIPIRQRWTIGSIPARIGRDMKIDKWVEYTAMCEVCNLRARDFHSGAAHTTRKEAVAFAKANGWKMIDGKTVCPVCFGLGEKQYKG